ncbi:hypothetical protein [Haloarcula laminariae]|uniref:hypothetical protein n=1 Tax=Haloarcula laminariae TaxID=2961577 RepID=UPI0021C829AC|nr:hypothetical protein [Halomicroarcula laminariae]
MMGVGLRELKLSAVFVLLTELVVIGLVGEVTVRIVSMTAGLSMVLIVAFLAGVEYEAMKQPTRST